MRSTSSTASLLFCLLLAACTAASPATLATTPQPTDTGLPADATDEPPTAIRTAPPAPEDLAALVELSALGYGYATDVAWSPDGKTLAVGTSTGINFYADGDWQARPDRRTFSAGSVNGLAYSPDGSFLAVAGREGLSLVDTATGQERIFEVGIESIGAAFSPDGKLLATGGREDRVRIWDVASGETKLKLQGGYQAMTDLAFSPDGKILATAGGFDSSLIDSDGKIRLWNTTTGALLTEISESSSRLAGVAFSPDGKILAFGGTDNRVRLWDMAAGKLLAKLEGNAGDVVSLAFSPDGSLLASSAGWQEIPIQVWGIPGGRLLPPLTGCIRHAHLGDRGKVAFSPDGSQLASTCSGSGVMVWSVPPGTALFGRSNTATGQSQRIEQDYGAPPGVLVFSPDGRLLASDVWYDSMGEENDIRLWDLETGMVQTRLLTEAQGVRALAFDPQGRRLALGGEDGKVRLWDIASGQPTLFLEGSARVASLAFSPDGSALAVGREEPGILEYYNLSTGEPQVNFAPFEPLPVKGFFMDVVDGLAFSPDGALLATSNGDHTIRVWDTATGRLRHQITGINYGASGIAFGPDGSTLTAAVTWVVCEEWEGQKCIPEHQRGDLFTWDMKTGTLQGRLTVGGDELKMVAFSPDGRLLATINSADWSVTLLDVATGQRLGRVATLGASAIAFSPDGSRLVVGFWDGTIHLFKVESEN